MIVGILSDTHGRLPAMIAAIAALREAKAEFFIHCGDVGGEDILDQLAGLPSAFVWGNNDFERAELARYAESIGVQCLGNFGELELGGKAFAVFHGDDFGLSRRLMSEKKYDYLLQGHSHVKMDERAGTMRVINPGALHRANPKSVAVLDTATDALQFVTILA
jgi:uncharacterized protein